MMVGDAVELGGGGRSSDGVEGMFLGGRLRVPFDLHGEYLGRGEGGKLH